MDDRMDLGREATSGATEAMISIPPYGWLAPYLNRFCFTTAGRLTKEQRA